MRLGAMLAYMSASCGAAWEGDTDCAGDIMLGGSVRTLLTSRVVGQGDPASASEGQTGPRARVERAAAAGRIRWVHRVFTAPGRNSHGHWRRDTDGARPAERHGTHHPSITLGIGYGRFSHVAYFEDETATSHGTFAFMVGGGLGLEFGTSGIGVNVGFQRLLKGQGGTTQLGIGMSWQGLTSAR